MRVVIERRWAQTMTLFRWMKRRLQLYDGCATGPRGKMWASRWHRCNGAMKQPQMSVCYWRRAHVIGSANTMKNINSYLNLWSERVGVMKDVIAFMCYGGEVNEGLASYTLVGFLLHTMLSPSSHCSAERFQTVSLVCLQSEQRLSALSDLQLTFSLTVAPRLLHVR